VEGENFGFLVITMTWLIALAVIVLTWVRGRHRIAEIKAGAASAASAGTRQVELLGHENSELKGQVRRLEERIATLERIVTDPAERTALEIEQLR